MIHHFKEKFTHIYDKELWGKGRGSGTGSSLFANKNYIPFLEKFLKENNIKNVLDYGCGDWQFSKYVDWGNTNYTGIDVVDSVIENNKQQFTEHTYICDDNPFPYLKDKDLIIIKDVLQHWPNKEITNFIDKLIKKNILILLVNQANNSGLQNGKRNIRIGGFATLKYDEEPLNKYNPKLIFKFRNRQVLLIKGGTNGFSSI